MTRGPSVTSTSHKTNAYQTSHRIDLTLDLARCHMLIMRLLGLCVAAKLFANVCFRGLGNLDQHYKVKVKLVKDWIYFHMSYVTMLL